MSNLRMAGQVLAPLLERYNPSGSDYMVSGSLSDEKYDVRGRDYRMPQDFAPVQPQSGPIMQTSMQYAGYGG
jgi:hypothetical protein